MEYDPTVAPRIKQESTDPDCSRFAAAKADQSWRHIPGENAEIDDGLHGDTDSYREVISEKPVHRVMADMAVAGYRPCEIARSTGFSAQWVSTILKQKFVRERMVKEIKKNVQAEMKEFLEQEVMPSLKMLTTVRDDPKARKSDVLTATNSLLDRFLGKPTQPISPNVKPPCEQSDEELREQVAQELSKSQPN